MPNNLNVAFKQGTQSRLDGLTAFQQGSFYLTTDTGRLYYANSTERSGLLKLNQYIRFIDTTSALPTSGMAVGDIYYIRQGNILAIYDNDTDSSGTHNGWTQLNPDTYLLDSNSAITVSGVTSGVSISSLVEDSHGHESSGSFSIIGGDNVTITRDGNSIEISSVNTVDDHTYTMGTEAHTSSENKGVITLTPTLGNQTLTVQKVNINGSGWAKIESSSAGAITINVPEKGVQGELSFNSNGVLAISNTVVPDGTETNQSVTPTISYGHANNASGVPHSSGAATSTAVFANSTAVLDIYTAPEVDRLLEQKMSAADAMQYKGTVGNGANAQAIAADCAAKLVSTASVGDTYKAKQDFTYGTIVAKKGDLIIAEGTDGAVTWDVIPSGDDYQLSSEATSSKFVLQDTISGENFLDITLAGSNTTARANIVVTGTTSSTTGVATYTFSHGDAGSGTAVAFPSSATSSQSTGVAGSASVFSIPVITAISKDEAGHISSIQTGLYDVIDSHNYISNVDVTADVSAAQALVQIEVDGHDGDSDQDGFVLKTSTGSAVVLSSASYTSGSTTYSGVQIDFVWGEF